MEGASVDRVECGQWGVYIGGHCYGTFGAPIDANCFALQLVERGMADHVTLPSGVIVEP